MKIDGRTQLVGLLGWPVAHSLSPLMHNAVFAARGLNWCYVPFSVPPGQIGTALQSLPALGVRGVNITAPYKQLALPFLDEITPRARGIGAVNTIVVRRNAQGTATLYGDNTDAPGFIRALQDASFETGGGQQAVVVGAGGAARAIVFGLLQASIGTVWVLNRSLEKSQMLIAELGRQGNWGVQLRTLPLSQRALAETTASAALLVNATSVGQAPDTQASIWPDDLSFPDHVMVFDLVYQPQKTRLLQQAMAVGAHVLTGIELLVQQGALAFELWTGERITHTELHLMRTICQKGGQE